MTRALIALLLLTASPALAADRSQPPPVGPPRAVQLPQLMRHTLSNGLPVLVARHAEVPTVQVLLLIGSGSAADPKARPGTAAMAADMLDEGAGTRNALELADALDWLGADLGTGASWDASSVRMHVPVRRLAEALPLMADIALRPTFPSAEMERLRKEALTNLLQLRDEPRSLGAVALSRAVFGDHRYGRMATGDGASLTALTVEELRKFHGEHYRPGNATLIVVGDVLPSIVETLESVFGSWPKGGGPPAPLPVPAAVKERAIWLVDRPGAAQSVVRVGQTGPDRKTPIHPSLEVMNTLLGGLFTSRLNDNLRETHGYAYGASSGFSFRRVGGSFSAAADVQTPSTAPALAEMVKELERIRTPAADDEVARARSYLAMSYPEEFETPGEVAGKLAELFVYGLPPETFEQYVPRVLAVDAKEMQQAAEATLDPTRMVIVVVGDRAQVEAPLRALNLGPLRIVPVDEVLGAPPDLK
jgi:zinc protease